MGVGPSRTTAQSSVITAAPGSHRYARQWARPWTMRRQVRMA